MIPVSPLGLATPETLDAVSPDQINKAKKPSALGSKNLNNSACDIKMPHRQSPAVACGSPGGGNCVVVGQKGQTLQLVH